MVTDNPCGYLQFIFLDKILYPKALDKIVDFESRLLTLPVVYFEKYVEKEETAYEYWR